MSNDNNHKAEKAKKKTIAFLRAERRLHNRLNDIDWEYDVLKPQLEELDKQITVGQIPEFSLVDNDDQDNDK